LAQDASGRAKHRLTLLFLAQLRISGPLWADRLSRMMQIGAPSGLAARQHRRRLHATTPGTPPRPRDPPTRPGLIWPHCRPISGFRDGRIGPTLGLLDLVAGAGLGEAVGVCADLDDVAAVGEPVDDGPRTSAGR
jgi:hypothetical protein